MTVRGCPLLRSLLGVKQTSLTGFVQTAFGGPAGSGTESSKKTRIMKTQHDPDRSVREKASNANAESGARNQGSKRNTLWRPSAAVVRRG